MFWVLILRMKTCKMYFFPSFMKQKIKKHSTARIPFLLQKVFFYNSITIMEYVKNNELYEKVTSKNQF